MASQDLLRSVQAGEEMFEMSAESSQGKEDDAPDEVTFSSAREMAERNVKAALENARRDKALVKEKRKRKMELFRDQKKRKMIPNDILQEIASLPRMNAQAPITSKKGRAPAFVQNLEQDSGLEEDVEEYRNIRWKGRYKAVRLKDYDKAKYQVRKAKAFIRNQLYGTRNRTSVKEYYSYANKNVHKAAMQFVDSSWGQRKKRAATKYCRSWLQKHCPVGS
ncbi:U3 small nucleolar RNA-associated protein NOL7 [Narcine bancroftii]|uniref:U3 small nucleolar RNA-associated protein NOL7 n=1 Tax=Narcine bancroftii TaxID=1343680 RepID=UPI003831FA2C